MKNQKKLTILLGSILGVLVLTLGITFAVFTYQQTGTNNQQLVLGDIYMHYQETNQLKMENAMPGGGLNKISTYTPNPVMQTEEPGTGVLGKCESFFADTNFDEGTTATSFCQGTGTASGFDINYWGTFFILQFKDTKLLEDNVFLKNDVYYTDVILNPIMQTEETGTGVLGKCESLSGSSFDEGTTATTFCRGTGTQNGKTLLEMFNENDIIKGLMLSYDIAIPKIDLPYFEFTISGKNTYSKKDIWYEVVLNHGDTPENRNTRIEDEFLKFSLFELNDNQTETEIFTNKSFSSLENKRIHVETIPKNTMNKINKTYRLYMWIDENVVIGNVDEDYTTEEWKDVFASIKVNVSGDFNEKALDASCFNYEIENNEVILTGYNTSCGNRLLIPSTIEGLNVTTIKANAFNNSSIKEVNLPSTITTIERKAFLGNNITNVNIPNSVTYLDCQAFDSSVSISKNDNLTCIDYVTPRSCFTAGTIDNNGETEVAIIDYDASCGSDVVIPDTIDGYKVTVIGNCETNIVTQLNTSDKNKNFNDLVNKENKVENISPMMSTACGSFLEKGLTSVVMPNSIVIIEKNAFCSNQLTSITIPNSVTTIGNGAFSVNQLETVTIGSSIQYIRNNTFEKSSTSNPNLSSITFTSKTCEEIKNIEASDEDTRKYFPWLASSSPYYEEGYKATIIGTDGECSY